MNDYRESMAGSSRQAAAAFLEDMEHVRALLKQPKPVNQSIRALSVTLRRLLVNGELAILAASRVGKILISAPDYHPVHVAQRKGAIDYFFGGPCPVFNRDLGSVGAYMLPVWVKVPNSPSPLSGLDPEAKIQLTLDSFMKQ